MSKKAVPGAAADAAGVTVVAAPTQMEECVVHPLVLLNCVDHYNRVAKDTSKRVIGVLLGNRFKGTVDATK